MNDPAYIVSNKDIIPPVFNVESSTITTDYCQYQLPNIYDITQGTWALGTTDLGKVADNSGSVNVELVQINGENTSLSSIDGFVPLNGENTFVWKATDPSGNETTFTQSITINRGECYKPSVAGTDLKSDVLVSTLNRENGNLMTTKRNGLLVLESKSNGLILTKVGVGEDINTKISEPVDGMIVFDENDNCLKLYDGNTWGCIKQKSVEN